MIIIIGIVYYSYFSLFQFSLKVCVLYVVKKRLKIKIYILLIFSEIEREDNNNNDVDSYGV